MFFVSNIKIIINKKMSLSPSKNNKEPIFSSFIHYPSRLKMPIQNMLIIINKPNRTRQKKTQSTRLISNPIHNKRSENSQRYSFCNGLEESNDAKKLNRLRISVLNQKKKKKIESSNHGGFCMYDQNIKKSKSQYLKNDFQSAVNKMIVRKQINSKQMIIKARNEQLKELMIRKHRNVNDIILSKDVFILNDPIFTQSHSKIRKNKDTNKCYKTVNSFYNSIEMNASQTKNLYLSGSHFSISSKLHPNQLRKEQREKYIHKYDKQFRNNLFLKGQIDIKPWNSEQKRYKTQLNDGKSGDLSDWMRVCQKN